MRTTLFRIGVLVLLVAMAAVAPALKNDSGLVIIRFGDLLLETSLVFFVLMLVGLVVTAAIAIRLFFLPMRVAERFSHSRRERNLYRGLLALQQGEWRTAEQSLTHSAGPDSPAIVYLAAAQAAHAQSADQRGEDYLKLASQQPAGQIAADLVRAQWFMDQEDYPQAADLLQHLLGRKRGNKTQALTMLLRACKAIPRWSVILDHARELEKANILDRAEIDSIRVAARKELFESQRDIHALTSTWQGLTRRDKKDPEIIAAYAKCSLQLGDSLPLQPLLESALKKCWQPELVDLYSRIATNKTKSRLLKAEKWLVDHPNDAVLLRTLGRLCLQEELPAKAKAYYLQSIKHRPDSETFQEMGEFAEKYHAKEAALIYFQNSLGIRADGPLRQAPAWDPEHRPVEGTTSSGNWTSPEITHGN